MAAKKNTIEVTVVESVDQMQITWTDHLQLHITSHCHFACAYTIFY